jgi:hypothetical protein
VDKVKSYGAHALAYVVSGLTVVAGLDPNLLPDNLKVYVGVAGLLLTAVHNVQAANAPKPGTITSVAKVLALFAFSVMLASSLVACKTAPTVKEQSAVAVAINIATGRAIQQNDTDAKVWKARAVQYKAIAVRLQAVNDAGTATVATLGAELQPLIAKLGPADQLAARSLLAAVTPYLQEQANANADLGNIHERVTYMLAVFVTACDAYGA